MSATVVYTPIDTKQSARYIHSRPTENFPMFCQHGNFAHECGLCVPPSQDSKPGDIFGLGRRQREDAKNKNLCACNCGRQHTSSISSPVRKLDGERLVFWYASTACQFRHSSVRKQLQDQ